MPTLCPLRRRYRPLWLRPERWRAALVLRGMRDAPFYVCEPALRTRTKIRPMLELAGVPDAHCQFIEDFAVDPPGGDEIDTAQVVAAWRRPPPRPSASAEAARLREGARQNDCQSVGCEG